MKPNVYKKRKYTKKGTSTYKRNTPREKTNKWAPKVSTREYKYIDNISTAVSISTASIGGYSQWLNNINLGSFDVNRLGNKIKMKTLHFKAFITPSTNPTSTPLYPNLIRMLIVYDAQFNGAATAPTLPEILQTMNSAGNQETGVFTGVNIGNRARFTILRDYLRATGRIDYDVDNITPLGGISTPANGCGGGQGSEKSGQLFLIDDFIQINMPTLWKSNPTQGSLTGIQTGALFFYVFCAQSSGTWAVNFASRLTFKEESN